MEMCNIAEAKGLPKIVSIQNQYHLLARSKWETDLAEVCYEKNKVCLPCLLHAPQHSECCDAPQHSECRELSNMAPSVSLNGLPKSLSGVLVSRLSCSTTRLPPPTTQYITLAPSHRTTFLMHVVNSGTCHAVSLN